MEDDDEFGDLYTDVLRPLTTSFQPQSQPPPATSHPTEISKAFTATLRTRPIDLNLNSDDDDPEKNFCCGATNSNSNQRSQTLASSQPGFGSQPAPKRFDLNKESSQGAEHLEGLAGVQSDSQTMVSEKGGDSKLPMKGYGGSAFADEADIDVVVEERDDKDDDFVIKDDNLVGEHGKVENFVGGSVNVENFGVGGRESKAGEMGADPIIPGVSIPGVSGGLDGCGNSNLEDDWDSDSGDDLQIVLNDNNQGPMGIEGTRGVMAGGEEDEDDEDGETLLIVADNDNPNHQPMMVEEQDWVGEEVGASGDGERKEVEEGAKVSGVGGVAVAPKIGYINHVYHHPYHSQFKYVRPGATPISGAASTSPGGTPGQVRPPGSVVPVIGRGRGDWRPIGIKGGPLSMQKGFHTGYGMPVWGTGASGRGYGSGLEFTLPSHKTIFEVDIDNFDEKPWRTIGIDITDFFNFGLKEESWKDYCKQLEQLRLETTMQSKIRVYESGRTEQDYDPDLPPELAAAAGIQDIPSESTKTGMTDPGLSDLAKGPARVRLPLPTGRAIQVETGYGERLPSSDTRKPRISDLDAIIEIVCQDSADDDSQPGHLAEQHDIDPPSQDVRDGDEFDNENSVHLRNAYDNQKKEVTGRRSTSSDTFHDNTAEEGGRLPLSSEAPRQYHPDSREQSPVYTGRNHTISLGQRSTKVRAQGRVRDSSTSMTEKECTSEKHFSNKQTEESTENSDGKNSPGVLSPVTVEDAAEPSSKLKDAMSDEIVLDKRDFDMDNERVLLDASKNDEMHDDVTIKSASKKQKLTSQVEQGLPHEVDDGEDSRTGRSSENSKAMSGSSKDNRKLRNSVEEEEVHDGRSAHMSDYKRSVGGDEDTNRRKVHGERPEHERHRIHAKAKDGLYPHKLRDPYSDSHSQAKYEAFEQRKESDNVEGIWQRRDEDLQGRRPRAEDTRKRVLRDETESRQRTKIREVERIEKDEHYQSRKQFDNGRRASYDKDMGSRHRDRDDDLKGRNESIDELHSKRRKEEAHLRRENAAKEEMLHAHQENSGRRKRERDDVFDQRRRDQPARSRDDDQPNVRVKEEVFFQRDRGEKQRDRDEWRRLKHSSEEIISKKDKEEARGIKNGRPTEDKIWGTQSKGKDEHRSSDKEYHPKDAGSNEVLKRRDRVENDSVSHHRSRDDVYSRGNQLNNDERREKNERASTRNDHIPSASDNYKVADRKQKVDPRRSKEAEVVECNSLAVSKKSHAESSGRKSDVVSYKGRFAQGSGGNKIQLKNPPPRKKGEEASSDDEQSESRRGRSKLERWTSHKERDFNTSLKSSSSTKIRQMEMLSGTGPSKPSHRTEDEQHHSGTEKDAASQETNNNNKIPIEGRDLDTVEKLKKRSERFKVPLASEKETTATKKAENELDPSTQNENRAGTEIKAERPARKRRWTSN